MAKTKLRDRAFALTLAALFLFTALATTIAVIYSLVSSNNSTSTSNSNSTSSSKNDTHLAGTKLAGFTPVKTVNKLIINDLRVGSGATASANSTVSVLYTGAVASTGIIFQASTDSGPTPVTFPLNNVIVGWRKGIPGMKAGGERQLIIPANEAYGNNPPAGSNIPPNAPLVFNITLLAVK